MRYRTHLIKMSSFASRASIFMGNEDNRTFAVDCTWKVQSRRGNLKGRFSREEVRDYFSVVASTFACKRGTLGLCNFAK